MRLVGFDRFDKLTLKKVQKFTQPLLDEFIRIFGEEKLLEFKLVVDKIGQNGGPSKYELIGNMNTALGLFHAKKIGFKILNLVNEVVENIERQVIEKKEKIKEKRTLPANV